jgi:hypothetical protein
MTQIQCEDMARYEVAEALHDGLAREVKPDDVMSIVFEVSYYARGLVGANHTVTRVRLNGGSYQVAKPGWTRDRMIAWLSNNGFEMIQNPVRSKTRTGTQIERHFWAKSLMSQVHIPVQEQGVRCYGN